MSHLPRTIGLFTLAMINVAAIGGLKNWSVIAEYGLASIFYIVLAAVIFFIPVSLVSAELATGWPKLGGVFVWVKEAFGHRTGFLAIWLQWIENVVWYPTILSFIGATIAYIFDPDLAHHTGYMVAVILVVFWVTTFINFLGMKTSGWISTWGVVLGTFIPAAVIITLGAVWLASDKPIQIAFTWGNLLPKLSSPDQLVFFTGIILAFAGMEMSAVHARDVKDPQRDYPKAMILSVILILGLTILGVLSIAIVIPPAEINLVAGSLQAFSHFVNAYNLNWLTPFLAVLIAIGAIGSLSTWIVGPCKGLLAAADTGDLPPKFRQINSKGMPVVLLIFQSLIVTLLSLVFLLMPSVNSGYWIINVLVAQLYLIMYIMMFAAAIKLRYKKPKVERSYKVPGGIVGMWIIGGIGILSSLFAMIIGFFPPSQIATGNTTIYVGSLLFGLIIFCLAPSFILLFQKPSWKHRLEHEKLER